MGMVVVVRHLFGFVMGVVLAPALAYGMGWSYARAADSFDPVGKVIFARTQIYGGFAVMAAVGLVVGVVIVARWASPLMSLLPALAFIGWTVYFLVDPAKALDLPDKTPVPDDIGNALDVILGTGFLGLLGLALFMPAWVPGRWSRPRAEPEAAVPERDPWEADRGYA